MALKKFSYEDISNDEIKEILEAAFIPFGEDTDGDLFIKDEPKTYITLSENKKRISFFCLFKGSDMEMSEKYEMVNKINMTTYFPKVMVTSAGHIRFDYDLDINNEISTLYFVSTLRMFMSRVLKVIRNDTHDNLFS